MQTNFTTEQLTDPKLAESEKILRTCVHCGFCTATCPTYVLLGDELDSPRGRIYLIKDMLESNKPATAEVALHIDRCLSCLACVTTCPSGVDYMHLIDNAREHVQKTYKRPPLDQLLRQVLSRILPSRRLFRLAVRAARLGRSAVGIVPEKLELGKRLRAMAAFAPQKLPKPESLGLAGIHKAAGKRRGRVALLTGCAQSVIAPHINDATVRLLNRLGYDVVVRREAECCGGLNHHMGFENRALAHARKTIGAWFDEIEREGLDAVIINTSGCGTTVKDYAHMFARAEEPWRSRAEAISARTVDITEFLTAIGYAPTREPTDLVVAYHSACSLQHGQKITAEPKELLRKAGFTVVEPAEGHLCCGSAGTYNLLQPEIAGRLRERKLQNLRARNPDLVAAGNVGCITQLSGDDALPVLHTVELLDWMAGGPEPGVVAAIARTRQEQAETAA